MEATKQILDTTSTSSLTLAPTRQLLQQPTMQQSVLRVPIPLEQPTRSTTCSMTAAVQNTKPSVPRMEPTTPQPSTKQLRIIRQDIYKAGKQVQARRHREAITLITDKDLEKEGLPALHTRSKKISATKAAEPLKKHTRLALRRI